MLALPIHDLPTRSASGFIIRHVLPRSAPPQLLGPTDRKQAFTTLAIGDVIVGVGHGSPDTFCGHNNQVLMNTTSMPVVGDKVVFLISCQTADYLGPALINAGASSFIGFNEDLVWVVDSDLSKRPWSDSLAATAMMPIVDSINSLLNGETVETARRTLADALYLNAEEEEDELIKACLMFDYNHLVMLGDPYKCIRETPKIHLPLPPPPLPPLLWVGIS